MHVDQWIAPSTLLSFILVFARVAGALTFVPIPGVRSVASLFRIVLALSVTCALFPVWPKFEGDLPGPVQILVWMLVDLVIGLGCGLVVGFLSDLLVMAVQAISLQAGFSYASTIDPNSEADSSVLQVIAQLFGNLLFFSTGLYADVIRTFSKSLHLWPPGHVAMSLEQATVLCDFGSFVLQLALRIALPAAGLLLLTDLSLAILGRLQSQLQLLSLSFPLKMIAAIFVTACVAPFIPKLYETAATRGFGLLARVIR